MDYRELTEIYHHGILGQKWGHRNGPPYPLGGGDYSRTEKEKIYKERKKKNSIYNKKHFDKVITTDDTISTLSYNKDRLKDTDYFYSTYKKLDKMQYKALFNKPIEETVYTADGTPVGTKKVLKYSINQKVKNNMKIASEDSSVNVFRNLYEKDRDFYNFVTDPKRMESHFVTSKYGFKGYREAKKVLDQMKEPNHKVTDQDLRTIYRMFNYILPSDAGGDQRRAKDVMNQRNKFFKALKEAGYGGVLDTNDAIYGGFKAEAPVIIFDMENLVMQDIGRVKMADKGISQLVTTGRKVLGI